MGEAGNAIEYLEQARALVESERSSISILGRALSEAELARLSALAAALSHIESAINNLRSS